MPRPAGTDAQHLKLAQENFEFFLGAVHETDMPDVWDGKAVAPPHLKRVIDRFQWVSGIVLRTNPDWRKWADIDDRSRHTSVVSPPGSAKTTILAAFYEWLLGRASIYWGNDWASKFHLGHASNSDPQAGDVSFSVRETIEQNEIYRAIFPKVRPHPAKFAEREWRVEGCHGKDSTFLAVGLRGRITGARRNFIGLDDICDEDLAESELELARLRRWLRRTIMRRLVPSGCLWMNQTRWCEDDPSAWAQAEHWTEILIRGLTEDGNSYWPERFPVEGLLAEREASEEDFALQYMGEPAPSEGIYFRQEHLSEPYHYLPLSRESDGRSAFWYISSWDTAGTTNPRSDYTAGWTAALDLRSLDVYLLNLYHDKIEFTDVLDAIRGQQKFFPCHLVLIEDKATGQPAAQMLLKEGLPILPLKPFGEPGQKRLGEVLKQIHPMLAAKRLHFPSPSFASAHGLGWVGIAQRQLLGYPRAKKVHDDIVRALIQLLFWIVEQQWKGLFELMDAPREAIPWAMPTDERVVV